MKTSLLSQLRQLQSLIKQTATKGAQTGTCLLIILVSLGLIILPSFSPFNRNLTADDDYRPTGVISRNILTDPSSSRTTTEDDNSLLVQSDSSSSPSPSELQSGPTDKAQQETIENPESTVLIGTSQEDMQSGNSSAPVNRQTEARGLTGGKGSNDVAKPGHADEM